MEDRTGKPANISAYEWAQPEVTATSGTIDALRDFANSPIRFNKKMSDPQKLVFGIYPADKIPTHHLPPSSQPDTAVENTPNHFEHKVRALNHATDDMVPWPPIEEAVIG